MASYLKKRREKDIDLSSYRDSKFQVSQSVACSRTLTDWPLGCRGRERSTKPS